ncbi:MAG: NUDIX hydrolase [Halobacteriales archaeon]
MEEDDLEVVSGRVDEAELRESAVVLPEVELPTGSTGVLLTRRADDLPRHAGEISFPGGGREAHDDSLLDTGLRELHEEVGVPRDVVDVRRQARDVVTTTGFRIRPYVARLPYPIDLKVDPTEVDRVFVASVDELTRTGVHEVETHGVHEIHYFHLTDHTVWGATAKILQRYLRAEASWKPESQRRA